MANTCKYLKMQKFVSYNSGATWQPLNEYKKGMLYESDSIDCGGGTTQYRWYPSGTTCVGYDLYNRSIRQYSNDGGESWTNVSPAEYTATTMIEHNSEDCGWTPSTPIYRWVFSGYTCIGYDKYELSVRQVSYDSGTTWEDVVPEETSATTLVETNSSYCGYVPTTPTYRWVDSGWTCIGYDKYQQQIRQVSYDSGATWTNVSPAEYTATTLIEANSEDCGYSPSGGTKWIATYQNGTVSSASCDSTNEIPALQFYNSSITSLTIGDCVTTIGESAFTDCDLMTSFYIPENVTTIGRKAFGYCNKVETITVGSGVGVEDNWSEGVFRNSTGLTTVNLRNGLTRISQSAFERCISLTGITIPDSVKIISDYAFNRCSAMTNVTIGSGVTNIYSYAFADCSGLTGNINIPDSVTLVGGASFIRCVNITSATIGNGVTHIDGNAFNTCKKLSTVTIGSGITRIDSGAFIYCYALNSLTINATTPPTLQDSRLYNTIYIYKSGFKIYVPAESVNAYKTAFGWSSNPELIQAIP